MNLIPELWIRTLGWTLVHSLWVIAGVALSLRLVLWLIPQSKAKARYLLSVGALLLAVGLVGFTGYRVFEPLTDNSNESINTVLVGIPTAVHDVSDSDNQLLPLIQQKAEQLQVWLTPHLSGLLVIWLSGVLFFLLRTTGNVAYIYRLSRRDTQPISAEWSETAAKISRALGIHRRVSIRISTRIRSPFVTGLVKPVILFPLSSFSHLSYDQLEAVLAHELAHIRRWDDAVNWIQTVFEIILFYHPALWWISQVIRDEREKCCDDLAVATCGNALVYAQALTQLESLPNTTSPLALALSGTGTGLLARIERLLQPNTVNNKPSAIPVTVTMLLAAALVINLQVQFPNNQPHSLSTPVYTGAILGLQSPSAAAHPSADTDSPWQPRLPNWLREEKATSFAYDERDTVPPATNANKVQEFYFRSGTPQFQFYYADSLVRQSWQLDSILSPHALSNGVYTFTYDSLNKVSYELDSLLSTLKLNSSAQFIPLDSLNRVSGKLDSLLAARTISGSNFRILSLDSLPRAITIHGDTNLRAHVFGFPDIDVDVLEDIDLDINIDDLTDIEILIDSVHSWSNRFQYHFSDTLLPPSLGSIPHMPMPPVMIFNDSIQEETIRVYEEAMRNYERALSQLDSADWERQLEQQMAQLDQQQRRFEEQMRVREEQYERQREQWQERMKVWEEQQEKQQQRYEERLQQWEQQQLEQQERQREQLERQQQRLQEQQERQQQLQRQQMEQQQQRLQEQQERQQRLQREQL
ncbi:MAG: M56 family metallopeptidase [Cyclobacteriaceae bacterium]